MCSWKFGIIVAYSVSPIFSLRSCRLLSCCACVMAPRSRNIASIVFCFRKSWWFFSASERLPHWGSVESMFCHKDGTESVKQWKDRSRAESWTPEMRAVASMRTKQMREAKRNGNS